MIEENKKMTEDEIKNRLSGRAMEYFMFMDDEPENTDVQDELPTVIEK